MGLNLPKFTNPFSLSLKNSISPDESPYVQSYSVYYEVITLIIKYADNCFLKDVIKICWCLADFHDQIIYHRRTIHPFNLYRLIKLKFAFKIIKKYAKGKIMLNLWQCMWHSWLSSRSQNLKVFSLNLVIWNHHKHSWI